MDDTTHTPLVTDLTCDALLLLECGCVEADEATSVAVTRFAAGHRDGMVRCDRHDQWQMITQTITLT